MPSRQGYDGMLLQTAHDRQNKVPYYHGVFASYIVKMPKWEGCHADDDAHVRLKRKKRGGGEAISRRCKAAMQLSRDYQNRPRTFNGMCKWKELPKVPGWAR